jgi:hypothetical protein
MTKSEYEHQYALARKTWPTITRSALSAIIAAYEKAIEQTQAILLSRIYSGVSTFDASLKAAIDSQLTSALTEITKVTEAETLKAIHRGYTGLAMIDTEYMLDAIKQAEATTLFSATGIKNIFIKIDHDLLIATAQRVTPDAYTFSARIWKSTQGFKPDVLNIINAGFAQGKPKEKIASALSSYLKDGKIGVAKKYGKLTPESARYMQRIGKDVDWRALRLVRSEYGASLQQVAVQKAFANFGASGIMEWIRTPGAVHEDVCSTYAARRYFKVSEVPGYPHPNCMCIVRSVMEKLPDTLSQLRAYVAGDFVAAPRIVEWANKYYKPVA